MPLSLHHRTATPFILSHERRLRILLRCLRLLAANLDLALLRLLVRGLASLALLRLLVSASLLHTCRLLLGCLHAFLGEFRELDAFELCEREVVLRILVAADIAEDDAGLVGTDNLTLHLHDTVDRNLRRDLFTLLELGGLAEFGLRIDRHGERNVVRVRASTRFILDLVTTVVDGDDLSGDLFSALVTKTNDDVLADEAADSLAHSSLLVFCGL